MLWLERDGVRVGLRNNKIKKAKGFLYVAGTDRSAVFRRPRVVGPTALSAPSIQSNTFNAKGFASRGLPVIG